VLLPGGLVVFLHPAWVEPRPVTKVGLTDDVRWVKRGATALVLGRHAALDQVLVGGVPGWTSSSCLRAPEGSPK